MANPRSAWAFGALAGLLLWGMPVPQPASGAGSEELQLEGVVFAPDLETMYAPVDSLTAMLDVPLVREGGGKQLLLGADLVPPADQRVLPDGTQLIRLRLLAEHSELGLTVDWNAREETAWVRQGERALQVRRGRRTVADAVTFAAEPNALYLPTAELTRALGLPLPDADDPPEPLPKTRARILPDGTGLTRLPEGDGTLSLTWEDGDATAHLTRDERQLWVRRGRKRVALNLQEQRLRAWEGERVVLETRISSGRKGMATPKGKFRAGPLKSRMVISHKYGDAEMPWSVQVYRNVFIHGFGSVPPRAASHGCVRMPLSGRNPARWFYEWVTIGTPIRIDDGWPANPDE